jgi:hypothetical protein
VFDVRSGRTVGYARAAGFKEAIGTVSALIDHDKNMLDAELVPVVRLETLPEHSPLIV